MTYKVHLYLDNKMAINRQMAHLPRTGDTVRFAGEKYAKVTEVIWCMDEDESAGQRVNVRTETETPNVKVRGCALAQSQRSEAERT